MVIRPEAVPSVDYPLVIHGEGVLTLNRKTVVVASVSAERLKYRPDLPWQVRLVLGPSKLAALSGILDDPKERPDVIGTTSTGESLVIRRFAWSVQSGRRIEGTADQIYIGFETPPITPTRLLLTAYLTDNPIARTEIESLQPQHDGTVTGGKRRSPQTIRSKLGTVSFLSVPVTEHIEIGGRHSTLNRYHAIARVDVPKSRRTRNIRGSVDTLLGEVKDLTILLSLFSRRHVGCSRIAAFADWQAGEQRDLIEAEMWNSTIEHAQVEPAEPLLGSWLLPKRGLNAILTQFRNQPTRTELARAIVYIVSGHQQRKIEHLSLYAFTALETLVSSLHPNPLIVDDKTFGLLNKGVCATIKAVAPGLGIEKDDRRQIYAKIAELQRRPIVECAVGVVERSQVQWADLWPQAPSLHAALQASYARRSVFIHTGNMLDPGANARDSIRTLALAERILLATLRVPRDWVSPRAYRIIERLVQDTL
jgi:hypothetical protein